MTGLCGRNSEIGRHGPTAWISGHQPGIWPSRVVRTRRRPCGVIICGRQRARWAGFGKPRFQRAEAQCQLIAAKQVNGDFVRLEHAFGDENFSAVQKDLAERRQSLEPQNRITGVGIDQSAEIPGIPVIQRMGVLPIEEPGPFQRLGHGTRHRRRDEPAESGTSEGEAQAPASVRTRFHPSLSSVSPLISAKRPLHSDPPAQNMIPKSANRILRTRSCSTTASVQAASSCESHASAAGSRAVCSGSNFLRVMARASWNCTISPLPKSSEPHWQPRRNPPTASRDGWPQARNWRRAAAAC